MFLWQTGNYQVSGRPFFARAQPAREMLSNNFVKKACLLTIKLVLAQFQFLIEFFQALRK